MHRVHLPPLTDSEQNASAVEWGKLLTNGGKIFVMTFNVLPLRTIGTVIAGAGVGLTTGIGFDWALTDNIGSIVRTIDSVAIAIVSEIINL